MMESDINKQEGITPVNIVSTEKPIPVMIEGTLAASTLDSKLVTKESAQTLAPNTTEEMDAVTAGQRKVNLIWEHTQRAIAVFSVFAAIIINASVIIIVLINIRDMTVDQLGVISMCLQFINLTAGIIIGFYFSRTNHHRS